MKKPFLLALLTAVLPILTACGGSDDDNDTPTPSVTVNIRSCSVTNGMEYNASDLTKVTISYNTVVKHTQNIYEKTGIKRSTNSLVAWFLSVNYKIDLAEFGRRLVAFALFLIMSAEAVDTTMSSQLVRRYPTRRIETRARRGSRRGRREDECDLLGLEI